VGGLASQKKVTKMALASIHFSAVAAGSNKHLDRDPDYAEYNKHVDSALTKNNENWQSPSYESPRQFRAELEQIYQNKIGQKMQGKATPIKEAVINCTAETTMDDLQNLSLALKEKYNIEPLRISLHRDEGSDKAKGHINHHAHIVFSFFDQKTAKTFRPDKKILSDIQDITADIMAMERGARNVKNSRKHQRPEVYKAEQELKKVSSKLIKKKSELEQLNSLNSPSENQKNLTEKLKLLNKEAEGFERQLTAKSNSTKSLKQSIKKSTGETLQNDNLRQQELNKTNKNFLININRQLQEYNKKLQEEAKQKLMKFEENMLMKLKTLKQKLTSAKQELEQQRRELKTLEPEKSRRNEGIEMD
jgi:hypothetical protein